MHLLNAPGPDVEFGPRNSTLTSVHAREALEQGAELFDWEGKLALSGQRRTRRAPSTLEGSILALLR